MGSFIEIEKRVMDGQMQYKDPFTGLWSEYHPAELKDLRRVEIKPRGHVANKPEEMGVGAPSTLVIGTDGLNVDNWGTSPIHYRWVNERDEKGEVKMTMYKGREVKKKTLRRIGHPHTWLVGTPLVCVRQNEEEEFIFKHWPAAVALYMEGALESDYMPWLIEEGAERFKSAQESKDQSLFPLTKVDGTPTHAVDVMLELGVIKEVDEGVYCLVSELDDVKAAVAEAMEEKKAKRAESIAESQRKFALEQAAKEAAEAAKHEEVTA